MVRAGLEPTTSGFQVWRASHSATLRPLVDYCCVVALSNQTYTRHFGSTRLIFGVGAVKKKTSNGIRNVKEYNTKNKRSRTMAANSHSSIISPRSLSSLTLRVKTPSPSITLFCTVFNALLRLGTIDTFLRRSRFSEAPDGPLVRLIAGSLFDFIGDDAAPNGAR